MKMNYRQKIFLYFFLIFTTFAAGIFIVGQLRERQHKTETLKEKLDAYSDIIDAAMAQQATRPVEEIADNLLKLFPENIRLTLIDRHGHVLYDNAVTKTALMENHAGRPEIIEAERTGKGSNVRISISNKCKYLYYAKRFNNYYIRVALPYDIKIQDFLKPDNFFLYYVIILFAGMLVLINLVAERFGKSISQLHDFAMSMGDSGDELNSQFSILNSQFSKDELGAIGSKIAENYRQLKENKKEIALEREKLLQHVYSSEEGLCFFSADKSVEFYNGLFVQYLNVITDLANSDPAKVFTDFSFDRVNSFLVSRETNDTYFETQIDRHGKSFAVRVNVFDDKSFEIIINDVTKQEKTRRLKQEMTGNITHELRTPVTGIRGCLETILEHQLDAEKKDYFIRSAYNQVLMLSELIRDMSLITKMEEAPQSFKSEEVFIANLLQNLKNDLEIPLRDKNIRMQWDVTGNIVVKGNANLLYSIFRNLTDNVIRYAGTDIDVDIRKFGEDRNFYYFSYSDNGVGIGEQHLNRIFERFYRVNEGRTRDTGGSGLGLSIVKNAVAFHKGTIVAKNKADGGLEFLFKLAKTDEVN
ncbi:MAG: two-component sensor histidine kinase [Prevotellaceae bacterium]|jgi:signal transduction histidine kinase|nr:two-component sensor histidine kinase [Prevotellaceae bacterium]